ncbi:hypothetical protein QBC32DRAFT_214995, partial [Pseudoneurospora amorphoporcata]
VISTKKNNSLPKPVLPDVEKFTGAQYSFDTWKPIMVAKLRLDGKALGSSEA